MSVPEREILSKETTYNTPKYLTHSEKTENVSPNENVSSKSDVKSSKNEEVKSSKEEKKKSYVEDWSQEGEGVLENEEWCSFLDSQLEECLRHDNQVKPV